MSNFAPPPSKPDSRVFASYPMPAKIDLFNERPRRESVIERHLETRIGEPSLPRIEVTEQRTVEQVSYDRPVAQGYASGPGPSVQVYEHQSSVMNQQQSVHQPIFEPTAAQQSQFVSYQQQPQVSGSTATQSIPDNMTMRTTTTTVTTQRNKLNEMAKASNSAAVRAAELADKEAKLMAEINALHQRPYSPYQVPAKIDLVGEQKMVQQQYHNAPSPRPVSRASSTRSTSAELADKEAKLLQEIEEISKKPYNPQTMVVEREQWYEYPEGRPGDRHLTDSKRRVKDFCSLPSHMYPDHGKHIHEENVVQGRATPAASSVQTTIIRSPRREVDNKSPLPFAFDNFTTKGVRGNIASVGAIEPDRPRAPIYPIVKRSPSPNMARG